MNFSYNISFSIAALIIMLILFAVGTRYSMTSIINKRYRLFLVVAILMVVLDIVTVATNDYFYNLPEWLNITLNSIYFSLGAFVALLFFYYIVSVAYKTHLKVKIILYSVNLGLFGLYLILLFINAFNKMFFYFDVSEGYSHGPLYLLVNLVSLLFIIESMIILFIRRKNFNLRQLVASLSFYAIFFISFGLQLFAFPTILLSDFGTSLGALIIFFSIETPDYVKLTKTLKELNDLKASLEEQVKNRTLELNNEKKLYEELTYETITTLASTIDEKDKYTRGHSSRVATYAYALSKHLGFSNEDASQLYLAGLMHDVGKIAITDQIITKPGKLTPDEYEIVKAHASIGGDILKGMKQFPRFEIVARYHHERYDGNGYPDGLKGENIPYEARIVQICDSFDAMTSDRSYRKALGDEVAINELIKGKGSQFDPRLVDEFIKLYNSFGDSIRNHLDELASDSH